MHRDFSPLPAAHDARERRRDQREAVDRALRLQLLERTDQGVAHGDAEKQHIFIRAGNEDEPAENQIEQVERRQEIVAKDLPDALCPRRRLPVRESLILPLQRLFLCQPLLAVRAIQRPPCPAAERRSVHAFRLPVHSTGLCGPSETGPLPVFSHLLYHTIFFLHFCVCDRLLSKSSKMIHTYRCNAQITEKRRGAIPTK